MGTKNNPSEYDCYDKAELDEPMFVLLARDPLAPILVRLWIDLRSRGAFGFQKADKLNEAQSCAEDMEDWYEQNKHILS